MNTETVTCNNTEKKTVISPYFLMRIAGIPIRNLTELRATETMRSIHFIYEQKQWLRNYTEKLCDEISLVVPKLNDEVRNQLIAYKRKIYNQKCPKPMSPYFSEYVPQKLLAQMMKWEEVFFSIQEERNKARESYGHELTLNRIRVQQSVLDSNFLKGVALTSRAFFSKVLKYIDTPIAKQTAKLRKIEYALCRFLSRVAGKTSPFSTFTHTDIGKWRAGTHADIVDAVSLKKMKTVSHVTFNHVVMLRLFHALHHHHHVRQVCSYQLNPTINRVDYRIHYVQRVDDSFRHPRTFQTIEKPTSLDYNSTFHMIFQLFQGAKLFSFSQIIVFICEQTGITDQAVQKFVHQLIDLQILVCSAHVPEQTDDIIADVMKIIAEWDVEEARFMLERLLKIQTLLREYGDDEPKQRASILMSMEKQVRELFDYLGVEVSHHSFVNLIYEDSVLDESENTLSGDQWEDVMADLVAYQKIFPLFDVNFRLQSAIAKQFVETYGVDGVCEHPLQFLQTLHSLFEKFNRTFIPGYEKNFEYELPSIRALDDLKNDFLSEVNRRIDQNGEVLFTREELEEIAAKIPIEINNRLLSHSFFIQWVKKDDQDLCVLNHCYSGCALLFSRFLPYFPSQVTEDLRGYLQSLFGQDVTLLELSPVAGFNANVHPPMASYELDFPMFTQTRPEYPSLPITDMKLVYDKHSDRVVFFHPEMGRMSVFYDGYLISSYLPTYYHRFIHMFKSGFAFDFLRITKEMHLTLEQRQQIRHYARMRIGRVILQRERWIIPRNHLVLRGRKEEDFDFFCRVHEWRKKLNLPTRFFFRMVPLEIRSPDQKVNVKEEISMSNLDITEFKPMYMDLESPLMMKLFGKMIVDSKHGMVMEEVLPNPDELAFEHNGEAYVTEFIMELSQLAQEV